MQTFIKDHIETLQQCEDAESILDVAINFANGMDLLISENESLREWAEWAKLRLISYINSDLGIAMERVGIKEPPFPEQCKPLKSEP